MGNCYTRSKWLSGFSFVVVSSAAIFVVSKRVISPGVYKLQEVWITEKRTAGKGNGARAPQ